MNKLEKGIIICKCCSAEHQLIIMQDSQLQEVSIEVHLVTERNFFKRLVAGLKYVFGYKCKYGEFDSIILDKNNYQPLKKVVEFLDGYADENIKHKPKQPKGQRVMEDGTDITKNATIITTYPQTTEYTWLDINKPYCGANL